MNLSHLPTHPSMRHPLTGKPLCAVGFRKSGAAIWPVLGGDDTVDPAGDQGDQGGNDDPDDKGADGKPKGSQSDDPKLAEARNDAASQRTKAREANERADRLQAELDAAKAKADKGDGPKPDEDAARKVTEAEQRAAAAEAKAGEADAKLAEVALRDTIRTAAGTAKGDAEALLDSNTFMSTVSKLDPDADDHATKVAEAITAAIKTNPRLGQAPGRGGSHFPGGSGERGKRSGGLAAAVAGHYGQ